MPIRSYLRILPELYERKALGLHGRRGRYSADAFVAFIGVLCLAEQQPTRGVFASEKLLRVLLEGPGDEGRAYAKQIGALIQRGDLVRGPAGTLIVDGWTELQEGNWQVAERMTRYRDRQRESVTDETAATVTGVTPPTVTPQSRARVPRVAQEVAVGGSGGYSGSGDSAVTRRTDTDRATPSTPTNGARLVGNAYATFEVLTGKPPSEKATAWLDDECGRYGREHVVKVMYATPEPTARGWMNRVKDRLRQRDEDEPDWGSSESHGEESAHA